MDTTLAPKVSIMMCTYNRASLIGEAITSALNQTFSDFELLILDDASTDVTEAVVKNFADQRVRYIKNDTRLNIAENRNKGLSLARGLYIAILDSDDRWNNQGKLAKQVEFLDAHSEVSAVGTYAIIIDSEGNKRGEKKPAVEPRVIRSRLLLQNSLINSSSLFRKALALEAGGYDNSLSGIEDYELWLKLGRSHDLANIPSPDTDYRVHGSQVTNQRLMLALAHFRLVKRYGKDYPNFLKAYIKGLLRIIRAAVLTV